VSDELRYIWIRIGTAISATCSILPVMLSAWNAKISTSVASRAAMLTGANRGNTTCSNPCAPAFARARSSAPGALLVESA
jgi:hypothetical protein